MGQKNSKKLDLFVTKDTTHCSLSENEVKKYEGRPREYTAVDVSVECYEVQKSEGRKRSHSQLPRQSIISVLSKAYRQGYQLSLVVPKIDGSKPSKLRRNSFIEEEPKSSDESNNKLPGSSTTHIVYLMRPKVNSRTKKENSLKKMEATQTILNIMINHHDKFAFSVKEFSKEISAIEKGTYTEELQKMISSEAANCGRLLSVVLSTSKNTETLIVDESKVEKTKENSSEENKKSPEEENATKENKKSSEEKNASEENKKSSEEENATEENKKSLEEESTTKENKKSSEEEKETEDKKSPKEENATKGDKKSPEEENATKKDKKSPEEKENCLTLRMVFLYDTKSDASPSYEYEVSFNQTTCTEEVIKAKKNQTPKSDRKTNVTWSQNWLNIIKDNSRLVDVINVGNIRPLEEESQDVKSNKPKPREFKVSTLCFYEKPSTPDNDAGANPATYDSMTREIWVPSEDTIQESLEDEAEKFGENGWELRSVLSSSQVRMKQDRSDYRKHAIFFQRIKNEAIPKSEMKKSKENLLENSSKEKEKEEEEAPSSPKEKLQKFGVAIMKMEDVGKSRLKSTSNPPSSPSKKEDPSKPLKALPAVQLKKVDREKLKKEGTAKDVNVSQQIKLKPTGVKSSSETKEDDKEKVPWMATLERKRKAVMESEEKALQKKQEQQEKKSTPDETETLNVAALKKKAEANAEAAKSADDLAKREKPTAKPKKNILEPEQIKTEKAKPNEPEEATVIEDPIESKEDLSVTSPEKQETEVKEPETEEEKLLVELAPFSEKPNDVVKQEEYNSENTKSQKNKNPPDPIVDDSKPESPQKNLAETSKIGEIHEEISITAEQTSENTLASTEVPDVLNETSIIEPDASGLSTEKEETNEGTVNQCKEELLQSTVVDAQPTETITENTQPAEKSVHLEDSPTETFQTEVAANESINESAILNLDSHEVEEKASTEPNNLVAGEGSQTVENNALPPEVSNPEQTSAEEPLDENAATEQTTPSHPIEADEAKFEENLSDIVKSEANDDVQDVEEQKTDEKFPDLESSNQQIDEVDDKTCAKNEVEKDDTIIEADKQEHQKELTNSTEVGSNADADSSAEVLAEKSENVADSEKMKNESEAEPSNE